MAKRRAELLLFAVYLTFILFVQGAPKHHHKKAHQAHKKYENPDSRSYIDIDASDPFKVPKSSQYIDQPVPEFNGPASQKDQVDSEEPSDGDISDNSDSPDGPPKPFDNIQEDLKHLGLENVANMNSDNDSPDDQPIPDQENGNNDSNKQIEIETNDQSIKEFTGDSPLKQNLPSEDEE